MSNTPDRLNANRKAKDSVFTDLFGIPKYLFELYKTLHPEDTAATVDSIKIITIENVLLNVLYNDLGFMVGNRLMVLVESQSTWSPNILIRLLLYSAQTYHEHLLKTKQDFYHSAKVKIPRPELYVVYTGNRKNKPERLSLSEEFFGANQADLEITATMIYETDGRDILNQYIIFCKIFTEQVKLYGPTKYAIEETIRICQDGDILTEYLKTRKKEVVTMLDSLFSEEELMMLHDHRIRTEAYDEGISRGINLGISQGISQGISRSELQIAKRLLALGSIPMEDIAKGTGLTIAELQKINDEIN